MFSTGLWKFASLNLEQIIMYGPIFNSSRKKISNAFLMSTW